MYLGGCNFFSCLIRFEFPCEPVLLPGGLKSKICIPIISSSIKEDLRHQVDVLIREDFPPCPRSFLNSVLYFLGVEEVKQD